MLPNPSTSLSTPHSCSSPCRLVLGPLILSLHLLYCPHSILYTACSQSSVFSSTVIVCVILLLEPCSDFPSHLGNNTQIPQALFSRMTLMRYSSELNLNLQSHQFCSLSSTLLLIFLCFFLSLLLCVCLCLLSYFLYC